jgi:hypothetical protein
VEHTHETVGSMDATVKPTGMYLRRVSRACSTPAY